MHFTIIIVIIVRYFRWIFFSALTFIQPFSYLRFFLGKNSPSSDCIFKKIYRFGNRKVKRRLCCNFRINTNILLRHCFDVTRITKLLKTSVKERRERVKKKKGTILTLKKKMSIIDATFFLTSYWGVFEGANVNSHTRYSR